MNPIVSRPALCDGSILMISGLGAHVGPFFFFTKDSAANTIPRKFLFDWWFIEPALRNAPVAAPIPVEPVFHVVFLGPFCAVSEASTPL